MRAEAADDGGDEGLEQRREAHVGLDDAGLRRPQHAGKAGKGRGDGEGDDDQAVDVEPDQVGGAHVLRRRAHAEPGIGAGHEPAEQRQATRRSARP